MKGHYQPKCWGPSEDTETALGMNKLKGYWEISRGPAQGAIRSIRGLPGNLSICVVP